MVKAGAEKAFTVSESEYEQANERYSRVCKACADNNSLILPSFYHKSNGAVYAVNRNGLVKYECLSNPGSVVVMPDERSVDIDYPEQLEELNKAIGYDGPEFMQRYTSSPNGNYMDREELNRD